MTANDPLRDRGCSPRRSSHGWYRGRVVGFWLRRSPLVFVVPGVLMLVPGSAGFNSVLQLLSNQTVSGISAGFDTFVTAMSIAYGLMVALLVLPRRFTSVAPRA